MAARRRPARCAARCWARARRFGSRRGLRPPPLLRTAPIARLRSLSRSQSSMRRFMSAWRNCLSRESAWRSLATADRDVWPVCSISSRSCNATSRSRTGPSAFVIFRTCRSTRLARDPAESSGSASRMRREATRAWWRASTFPFAAAGRFFSSARRGCLMRSSEGADRSMLRFRGPCARAVCL